VESQYLEASTAPARCTPLLGGERWRPARAGRQHHQSEGQRDIPCGPALPELVGRGALRTQSASTRRWAGLRAATELPGRIGGTPVRTQGGFSYVETANLDGETNLKIKIVPKALRDVAATPELAARLTFDLECDAPDGRLDVFSGTANVNGVSEVRSHPTHFSLSHAPATHSGSVQTTCCLEAPS
jgi:hypothetical protein